MQLQNRALFDQQIANLFAPHVTRHQHGGLALWISRIHNGSIEINTADWPCGFRAFTMAASFITNSLTFFASPVRSALKSSLLASTVFSLKLELLIREGLAKK